MSARNSLDASLSVHAEGPWFTKGLEEKGREDVDSRVEVPFGLAHVIDSSPGSGFHDRGSFWERSSTMVSEEKKNGVRNKKVKFK